jgi:hypothetical protein
MRACICLRGLHYSNDDISVHNRIRTDYRDSLDNYREYIINPLISQGYLIDILLFTYESPLLESLIEDYNPLSMSTLPISERYIDTSWNRQILFHKHSVDTIKKIQYEMGYSYDLIINTRFDLKFNTRITDMNIDYSKFNIAFRHSSGNCDDNLWIFNSSFLDEIDESMNILYRRSEMTHEINKYICNINYMHEGEYLYWIFLRVK